MNGDAPGTLAARALDPSRSVVVAACAGSGKTWLLVSRILRLLLAGVAPGEILAITFTRAAAQEMAARLREWLQFLAGADDDAARRFLAERCVPADDLEAAVARCRLLHEQVLTAQPGISITTFHSWYLQLLRNAPLSAGALGSLTLTEQTAVLIDEAWDLFAEACRRDPNGPAAAGLDMLFRHHGLSNARKLLLGFLQHRADWWAYAGQGGDAVSAALDRLRTALDVDPETDLVAETFATRGMMDEIRSFAGLLERNTPTDQAYAKALATAIAGEDARAVFEALSAAVLTTTGEPRRRKPSRPQQQRLGTAGEADLLALHAALCERMLTLRSRLVDQDSMRLHAAALPAAVALLAVFQQLKRDRQIVDFADVEWLAYDLLAQHEQAVTLQFKLDSRYRHILLDEFQDTNPLQWLSLKAWFDASAAAQSSSVVFLVGDPKQAIYRFRRAEARLFDAAREWLIDQHAAVVLEQDESRRCAPQVLDIVNRIFGDEPAFASDFRAHSAHDLGAPGRVEVLPLVARSGGDGAANAGQVALRNPLTSPRVEDDDVRREVEAAQLAQRLRDAVADWEVVAAPGSVRRRPVRYADIMILVRRRTHLQVYERALRHAGIPFNTSRRGGLLDTLEVQDLLALLGFLNSPFDDLKLAHALRSPIFGCSDDDLMTLAQGSGSTWWLRLLGLPGLDPGGALGRARDLLSRWLDRADRLPVHDHLDKIYCEGDVERRYAAAVPSAVRAAVVANLHAFIERALDLDAGRYPSLPRFLDELKDLGRAAPEEAPDEGGVDDGGDAVRILTVHGAKGLEAPIVWVLDAAAAPSTDRGYEVLVDWPAGAARPRDFSFRTRRGEWNRIQRSQMESEACHDEREDLNLLYVALTRARQILIVSGCEGARSAAPTWYARIRAAVAARAGDGAGASTVVLAHGAEPRRSAACAVAQPVAETLSGAVPIVLPASTPAGRRREIAVSPGQRYGTAFHRLMECMAVDPGADALGIAAAFGLAADEARQCVDQARALLSNAAMQRFFDHNGFVRAYNELPLIDEAGDVRRVDRLVEFADEVWILDYKTGGSRGSAGEDLEAEYRDQVSGYCRAIGMAYPGKRIRGALVFADGRVVEIAA